MGVRLSPEEIDEFLAKERTVIFTCLNKDGTPHSTPLWFLWEGGALYARTMRKLQKVKNVQRDARVSCVVETGEEYLRLKSVVINGTCTFEEDPVVQERFSELFGKKYGVPTTTRGDMPEAVRKHYSDAWVLLKVTPEKFITWDNAKIRLKE